jgi:hypothetical protein
MLVCVHTSLIVGVGKVFCADTLLLMHGIWNVAILRGIITERPVYFQNMNPFYVTNIYINF